MCTPDCNRLARREIIRAKQAGFDVTKCAIDYTSRCPVKGEVHAYDETTGITGKGRCRPTARASLFSIIAKRIELGLRVSQWRDGDDL